MSPIEGNLHIMLDKTPICKPTDKNENYLKIQAIR
jgi:hypothetical protein